MPDITLSQPALEHAASANADDVALHTLQIDHPDFTAPLYLVNNHTSVTATLETAEEVEFVAFAFDFRLPDLEQAQSPDLEIAIDNVSREILYYIDLASQSQSLATITYRLYLASDLTEPQNSPPLVLTVLGVSADVFRVRITAGFSNFANLRFPREDYTAARFPGLVAA